MKHIISLIMLIIVVNCQQQSILFPKFLSVQQAPNTEISSEFLAQVSNLIEKKMEVQVKSFENKLDSLVTAIAQTNKNVMDIESQVASFQQQIGLASQMRNKQVEQVQQQAQPQVQAQTQPQVTPQAQPQSLSSGLVEADDVQTAPQVEKPKNFDALLPSDNLSVDSYNYGTDEVVQEYQNYDKPAIIANQTASDGSIEIAYSLPVSKFVSETSEVKGHSVEQSSPQQRYHEYEEIMKHQHAAPQQQLRKQQVQKPVQPLVQPNAQQQQMIQQQQMMYQQQMYASQQQQQSAIYQQALYQRQMEQQQQQQEMMYENDVENFDEYKGVDDDSLLMLEQ